MCGVIGNVWDSFDRWFFDGFGSGVVLVSCVVSCCLMRFVMLW